jgi:hypothetical protein
VRKKLRVRSVPAGISSEFSGNFGNKVVSAMGYHVICYYEINILVLQRMFDRLEL